MSWTLQAPDGEFNIRIASGLMIGEDAQGNLEITPTGQTALVRFEVEDGALRIRLMSRAWALTRNNKMMGDSLRNERTAELHLPNNVIRIVGGENSAVEPERIELTPRVSMRWLLPTPERTEEVPVEAVQPPPVQATEDIAEPELEAWPEEPIENPEHVDVPIQPAQPAQPTRQSEHYEPAITVTPTEILPVRLPSRRRRVLSPLMAALFGLGGGIAVALLYQTLSREPTTASNTAPTTDAGSSAIQASASPPSIRPKIRWQLPSRTTARPRQRAASSDRRSRKPVLRRCRWLHRPQRLRRLHRADRLRVSTRQRLPPLRPGRRQFRRQSKTCGQQPLRRIAK